jgi:hypothetical protein
MRRSIAVTDAASLTIKVEPDSVRLCRYRWAVLEAGRQRDKSIYTFATRREAQADADRFVEKLKATWQAAPPVKSECET